MQRGDLQRDSSPRECGLHTGTPVATRGVLEILAAKEPTLHGQSCQVRIYIFPDAMVTLQAILIV
jgi:hypothetical protein